MIEIAKLMELGISSPLSLFFRGVSVEEIDGYLLKLSHKDFIFYASFKETILMTKRTLAISLLLAFGMIVGLTLPVVSASSVSLQSTNEQVGITLTILDAYYCDADADNNEDDVVAYFDLTFSGKNRYNIDLYPSLILPSGTEYTYAYVLNTRLDTLHCVMYFYNHATESGDYTFSVEVVSYTGGVVSGVASYVFDPPGGSGDADPCGTLTVT